MGDADARIDALYDQLDQYLSDGRWIWANRLLKQLDVHTEELDVLVAVMAMAHTAKQYLVEYEPFAHGVARRVLKNHSQAEAEQILRNLMP